MYDIPASFSLGGRNPREEFLKERIDGATFFDIDEVSDKLTPYPHMLPSAEQFSNHVGKVRVEGEGGREGGEREEEGREGGGREGGI